MRLLIRNFKALGTSMFAVVALGVALAAPAQAEGVFSAGAYPATVSGDGSVAFSTGAGVTVGSCAVESFSGALMKGSPSITVTPSFGGCTHSPGSSPVTIATNGCTYTWAIDTISATTGTGTETLNCPEGKQLEVLRYESKAKQEKNEPLCAYGLPAAVPVSGIEYEDLGSGSSAHVNLDMNVTFQATVLKGVAIVCGGATGKTVSFGFSGSVDLTAENAAGAQVSLSTKAGGVYLAGEESGEPATQPRIEAEWGATSHSVGGNQTSPHSVTLGVRTFKCAVVGFSAELANAVQVLPVSAAYSGCTAVPLGGTSALPAAVKMNSCHYSLNVLNVGPPYAGSLGVACSNEGDSIEFKMFENKTKQEEDKALCLYKLAPQSGSTGVELKTVGADADRGVALGLKLGTLQYSASGPKLVCGMSGSNGVYSGGTTLYGL